MLGLTLTLTHYKEHPATHKTIHFINPCKGDSWGLSRVTVWRQLGFMFGERWVQPEVFVMETVWDSLDFR